MLEYLGGVVSGALGFAFGVAVCAKVQEIIEERRAAKRHLQDRLDTIGNLQRSVEAQWQSGFWTQQQLDHLKHRVVQLEGKRK